MDSTETLVTDVVQLLDKHDNAAIVIYRSRKEDQGPASVSYSGTLAELIDLVATAFIVASGEVEANINLDRLAAVAMVRDAVDEKLAAHVSGKSGTVRRG